ncbi:MAG: family hydrolase [Subtercola sp.]|nr:family hydrolase [Subtercola sp.]
MVIKAALFDIDGTLVDSNEFHVMAWDEALRDGGHRVEQTAIRSQIGKGADMLLPSLVPELTQTEQKTIGDRHGEIFRARYLGQVRPFPHAADLLALLHSRGIKVALASSAEKRELDFYTDLLNIKDLLVASTSADDVEKSKPAADIFQTALGSVFPLEARDTVAVGDTPYDIIAATKCGIRTIALRSGGFSQETLSREGPLAIFGSVQDLFENVHTSPFGDKPATA